jgi:hypothetical protein
LLVLNVAERGNTTPCHNPPASGLASTFIDSALFASLRSICRIIEFHEQHKLAGADEGKYQTIRVPTFNAEARRTQRRGGRWDPR